MKAIAGEETDTQKHAKTYFTAYTSGSMAGRITGDKGDYDPANNLYQGMNRVSMYGNLEKAGQKRIDRINKTIAKIAKIIEPLSLKNKTIFSIICQTFHLD